MHLGLFSFDRSEPRDHRNNKSRKNRFSRSIFKRRLLCEPLEDRNLLSVFAATQAGDGTATLPTAPADFSGVSMWNDVVTAQMAAAAASDTTSEPITFATTPTYNVVVDNGPSTNRVDLVFLGDGYTANLIDTTYVNHINAELQYMFQTQDPLTRYQHFFDVYRVNVVSNQTGADVPPQGIYRDTALDASYYYDGVTDRLLYINESKANAAISTALAGTNITPEMKFVTVNDSIYGGGGGNYAVYAGANSYSNDIAVHESGHSFANLADEYDYSGGATYTGAEPSEPNVTISATGQKWAAWKGYVEPDYPELGTVGAYQGAMYCTYGIYRPTLTSKMQALGEPFNAVSREAFIHEIYTLVHPLDSWTDNTATITNGNAPITVVPVDSDVIQVEWSVDGQVITGATGNSFVPSAYITGSGLHTVTARAYDPTDWVRLDRSGMEQSVTWKVQLTTAESLVVTTANDVVDANDNVTSLREAVAYANSHSGADTITFDSSLIGKTITLTQGELDLTDTTGKTTITGLGADQLSVSGNNTSRVFYIDTGATVGITGLTITKGHTVSDGGGIYSQGMLTITSCTISGNLADHGGGIYNEGNGTVTITGSTVSGNSTTSHGGGGIYNANHGSITVTDSKITDNSAAYDGGGIHNVNHATVAITNSTISGNSADHGGGIYNEDNGTNERTAAWENGSVNSRPSVYICGSSLPLFSSPALLFPCLLLPVPLSVTDRE